MLHFTRDNIPSHMNEWQKRVTTKAVRIQGPFEVETREGTLRCPDGYLAVDTGGWPYPIAADEFERIYALADGEQAPMIYDEAPEPTARRTDQPLFKLGDKVRRTDSLVPFIVASISHHHGGKGRHRYYGNMVNGGGLVGAYENQLVLDDD